MNTPTKYWLTTFGLAALFSLMFLSAFMLLASSTRLDIQSQAGWAVFLIFFRNWLILTLIFTPIVHGLREEDARWRPLLITLGGAVLFGGMLVAPFALMEYWNNPRIQSGEFAFPFLLFFALWLSPTLFFLGAAPIVRGLRAGQPIWARPRALLLRVAVLAFLALTWVSAILDQVPCFLGGVPGCD